MRATPYLAQLTDRLLRGARALPDTFRGRQIQFLVTLQNPDGGFSGRQGPSDLYYTSFALRCAQLLNVGASKLWNDAAAFLRKNATEPAEITDALSLLLCRTLLEGRGMVLWCEACRDERLTAVRAALAGSRLAEGGFAKTPGGDLSLYHTFLATLCYELLDEPIPDAEVIAERVLSRQCPSGGFGDVDASGAEGTNPTAAAVAVLSALDRLDDVAASRAGAFVASMQRADGGLAATPAAPVSDLMSTFTALTSLIETECAQDISLGSLGRYVKSLARSPGGFRASAGDESTDVEYTYYGLGALALLAEQAASRRSCCT